MSTFVCQSCGAQSPKWAGKCPACGEWNALVETVVATNLKSKKSNLKSRTAFTDKAVKLSDVKLSSGVRLSTGISEFDRVLGNGFVPGQVVLLAGEPGIGKSTLLLQLAEAINSKVKIQSSKLDTESNYPITQLPNYPVLYIAGEESPEQIKIRAQRLGLGGANLEVITTTDVDEITAVLNAKPYTLCIVDSVQTLTTFDLASMAGSVAQVKECAGRLARAGKEKQLPIILVGHVNKEGDIAGPKVLEHLVDTVMYLEGERSGTFRLLKAIKNRFGDPSEVGVFKMTEKGFAEVKDPAALLLETNSGTRVGSVVSVVLEGSRPMMLEVQALSSKSAFNYPRRSSTGYDLNRLYMLVAVLEKAGGLSFFDKDVYLNVAGGVAAEAPSTDLAVILALASSLKNAPLPAKTVVFGEVGLSGEIRQVAQVARREKESQRLGYNKILGPNQIKSVREALKFLI